MTLQQVDLASDISGMASVTDFNLENARGNSLSPASPLWPSNQASDNLPLYSITPGSGTAAKSTAVQVTMPDLVAGSSGQVAGSLLVGNFGDGRINIIAKRRHHYSEEDP